MAFCKYCGNETTNAKYCGSCGAPVTETPVQQQPVMPPQQPVMQQQPQINPNQPYPYPPQQPPYPYPPQQGLPKDDMGLLGLIFGIIGFLCCTFLTIPGLICSIISMNNVKAHKVSDQNKWMGIVGLILSILKIVVWIINTIVNFASFVTLF